ncbi:MAG: hypothetical protein ACR2FG_01890, partial [Marmoricola sp.]
MRTTARTVLAVAVTLAATVSVGAGANADPHHPVPSRHQVQSAQQVVNHRAHDVASIRASLALANQRLEQAGLTAEIAAEKYNGALWRLGAAKRAVAKAERRSEAAKQEVADQRQEIALLVTQNYRSGPQIDQLTAMVHGDGVSTLMTTYGAVHGAGTSMQAKYDSYLAAKSRARVYEAKAVTSRSTAAGLATTARADRDRAGAAAYDAQAQAGSIAVQKSRLIKDLARAQGISTALVRTRQSALEEQARARAEAQAQAQERAEAKAAAQKQAQRQAQRQAQAQAQARVQAAA